MPAYLFALPPSLRLQDLQVFEDAKQHLARNRGHDIPNGFVTIVQMPKARADRQRRVTFG
jgi:hypothetical protein